MQRYKSVHTGAQIDSGVERALPGGEIDASLSDKQYFEFLDNTDFTNPVAQAGVGGLHGSVAYAVDRWKLLSGTVSWSSNGLTLNGTIRQIREFPIGFPVVPSIEMHSGTATATYDDAAKQFDITSSGGTIKRAHLGLIAITDWSKIPPADYGEELRKCQRYYLGNKQRNAYGKSASATAVYVDIPTPVTMRALPVIETGAIGSVICNGVKAAIASINPVKLNDESVTLHLVLNTSVSVDYPVFLTDTKYALYADL